MELVFPQRVGPFLHQAIHSLHATHKQTINYPVHHCRLGSKWFRTTLATFSGRPQDSRSSLTSFRTGGQLVELRERMWEICVPITRWTLQHSLQSKTPLLMEAQAGSKHHQSVQQNIPTHSYHS